MPKNDSDFLIFIADCVEGRRHVHWPDGAATRMRRIGADINRIHNGKMPGPKDTTRFMPVADYPMTGINDCYFQDVERYPLIQSEGVIIDRSLAPIKAVVMQEMGIAITSPESPGPRGTLIFRTPSASYAIGSEALEKFGQACIDIARQQR